MEQTPVLGIDIGGSAVKAALCDLVQGEFLTEKLRLPTPELVNPDEMAELVAQVISHFNYSDFIGCGFPAKMVDGRVSYIANIHPDWLNLHVEQFFQKKTGRTISVVNDADCAGLAEMAYSADASQQQGLVLFLTLGTGIGSALFHDGKLIRNTELGHAKLFGADVEDYAAAAIRESGMLSWKEWGARLDVVLNHLDFILSPDLIILGGGISKDSHKFIPSLTLKDKIKPARLQNRAGIIGAALHAVQIAKPGYTPGPR